MQLNENAITGARAGRGDVAAREERRAAVIGRTCL